MPYLPRGSRHCQMSSALLLNKVADILHRVVRRSIQLVDIERTILVERATRVALVTRLGTHWVLAVDRLGEDSCTGGFTHSARTAEEVGVSQLTTLDGILQCRGDMILSHHACKGGRAILSSRYYKLLHNRDKVNKLCVMFVIFSVKMSQQCHNFCHSRPTKPPKRHPKRLGRRFVGAVSSE